MAGRLVGGLVLFCLEIGPGLLLISVLIIWSAQLTGVVARRVRSAAGAVPKFRYALPALVAWCWLFMLGAQANGTPFRMPVLLRLLLPLSAPLLGQILAERCRPPAEQG